MVQIWHVISKIQLPLHSFNGLFSRTTWVSWYQKGKTSLDLNEARDNGVLGWQWHQLGHMQTILEYCVHLEALFVSQNAPRFNCSCMKLNEIWLIDDYMLRNE